MGVVSPCTVRCTVRSPMPIQLQSSKTMLSLFLLVASGCASIPTTTLPGAGAKLPMLYMGMGNFTAWVELVGKGAGVKTAWGYHNQKSVASQIASSPREDIFLESMIPCGFVD